MAVLEWLGIDQTKYNYSVAHHSKNAATKEQFQVMNRALYY